MRFYDKLTEHQDKSKYPETGIGFRIHTDTLFQHFHLVIGAYCLDLRASPAWFSMISAC